MPERKPLLSAPGTDLGAPRLKSCPKHEGSMAQREAYGSRDADIVSELETRDPTGHRLASADQPAPRTRGVPFGKLKPYFSMYLKVVVFSTSWLPRKITSSTSIGLYARVN